MTKYVSIIGNGESRRGFDISPLKLFSTVIGCNAIFRDFVTEYLVCADRHMCQQAANAVGKGTTIYTRENWAAQFAHWPNVKVIPKLPYAGDKRQDDTFHWGTGPHAGELRAGISHGAGEVPSERDIVPAGDWCLRCSVGLREDVSCR